MQVLARSILQLQYTASLSHCAHLTCTGTLLAASTAQYSSSAAADSWSDVILGKVTGGIKSLRRDRYPKQQLQPGTVSPQRSLPAHVQRPEYVNTKAHTAQLGISKQPEVHDEQGRAAMRAVGQLAARALQFAGQLVRPGITTDQIDAAVHDFIIAHNAYPSPLNYRGFPKSICTSVNEVVCHGIPDSRPLQEGDIVNVDVTVFLNGHHGDTNATFFVGKPSAAAVDLVDITQESLAAAVQLCGPGVPFRAIGHAIHSIADAAGMSVVREFVGHGIGKVFHAAPAVFHYRNWRRGSMVAGQTFTIEPILTLGGRRHKCWNDGWTVVTTDGSLTAQFEHTLLITENGVEVLTELVPPTT